MRHVNDLWRCVNCKGAGPSTHGYEEDAAEQSPSERRFDDLFITPGASAVSPQQRRDVEGHLGDGAEGGVHHCSHCKITLCRQATHTIGEICLHSRAVWAYPPRVIFKINITWLYPCR